MTPPSRPSPLPRLCLAVALATAPPFALANGDPNAGTGALAEPPGETDASGNGWRFERAVERARALAGEPYDDARLPLAGAFAELDYDAYRDIRFDTDRAVWEGNASSFALDLMPPGSFFDRPVEVHVVEDGRARAIDYADDWFTFGPLVEPPSNPDELTFSGFRLRSPLNAPDVLDEVVVFQGASYFRAVARGQLYGLSARALAIDTATERGEEFPRFTAFWIERPRAGSASVTVDALLDSPSVTGAFRFVVTPGEETRMDVSSVLFARRDVEVAGIAPLTSMFLFDATNRERFDDYRDAVHDSEGLQMITGRGERVWRSLANPVALEVSRFVDTDPVGFGLVQRHREFADFEDAEARYERRPSAWIEPLGDWGAGSVQLVEIPTDVEANDNVVAFWRPEDGFAAGGEYRYDYRLLWTDRPADDAALLRVGDARIGRRVGREGTFEVVVDFPLDGERPPGTLRPVIDTSSGEITSIGTSVLAEEGRYRVHFDFVPGDAPLAEWRLQLNGDDGVASETWLYRWTAS